VSTQTAIDLHAHVLPGLDDGPRRLEEAVALVRAAGTRGTATMVATSHVNRRWGVGADQIAAAHDRLRAALARDGVEVELLRGAEIAIDRLPGLQGGELDRLGLGGGATLLVECPLREETGDPSFPVRRLLADGRPVLLAHPERSPLFQREPERLARLVAEGATAQLTAASFAGAFGRVARDSAIAMLRAGIAHLVASDAHDRVRRPPGLADGLAALRRAAPDLAGLDAHLGHDVPAAVLAGAPVPVLHRRFAAA
jgi:protein-tyrosine phosphatase